MLKKSKIIGLGIIVIILLTMSRIAYHFIQGVSIQAEQIDAQAASHVNTHLIASEIGILSVEKQPISGSLTSPFFPENKTTSMSNGEDVLIHAADIAWNGQHHFITAQLHNPSSFDIEHIWLNVYIGEAKTRSHFIQKIKLTEILMAGQQQTIHFPLPKNWVIQQGHTMHIQVASVSTAGKNSIEYPQISQPVNLSNRIDTFEQHHESQANDETHDGEWIDKENQLKSAN